MYLYANQQGCDGERAYYDGCAVIVMNGEVMAQGSQFSLEDVEVVTATVDLTDVRSYRGAAMSRCVQAARSPTYPRVKLDVCINNNDRNVAVPLSSPITPTIHSPSEEISLGPACWLWDYLRRSKCNGFFLPLSGGIDSCSTALIVHSMCSLILERVRVGDPQCIKDVRTVCGDPEYLPQDVKELTGRLFCTCYMGSKNSSVATKTRAKNLANEIGR